MLLGVEFGRDIHRDEGLNISTSQYFECYANRWILLLTWNSAIRSEESFQEAETWMSAEHFIRVT